MVVCRWDQGAEAETPPLGFVGEIIEPRDQDGDYNVTFPDWPCWDGTCDWFTPHWAIVPIDDGESVAPGAMAALI
jgi:hypothetical protein